MLAENTKAFIQMIEDPSRRRYAGAVNTATENTIPETFGNYKIYSVGDLAVATIVRSPVVCQVAIFSTFARDKSDREQDLISGIQFAIPDPDGVGQDKPQKWVVTTDKPFEKWVGDEYVSLRLDEGIAIFMESITGRGDSVIRVDPESTLNLLDPSGVRVENPHEADRTKDRIKFFQDMDRTGYNDASHEEVVKVAEALEIVVFPGKWRKAKKLARAETLFREVLGLTG